jgi:hypothetical protein
MRRLGVLLVLLSPTLLTLTVKAADLPQQCAALPTAAERIVCYDRLFPPQHRGDAPAASSTPVAPSAPIANTSNQPSPAAPAAGSSQPASNPPNAPVASAATDAPQPSVRGMFDKPQQIHLKSTIKAIYREDSQPMAFLLANEQIWLQDSERLLPFHVGDAVTIKNGTFGGYFLTAERGTKTRVRRIK